MKKYLKGGIETIIATVVIVGLVVALIVATVIPMGEAAKDTSKAAVDNMVGLQMLIDPSTQLTDQNGQ